jgi:hypothetical protein
MMPSQAPSPFPCLAPSMQRHLGAVIPVTCHSCVPQVVRTNSPWRVVPLAETDGAGCTEGHPPTDQITALANKVAMEAGPVGLRPAVDPASNELVRTRVSPSIRRKHVSV